MTQAGKRSYLLWQPTEGNHISWGCRPDIWLSFPYGLFSGHAKLVCLGGLTTVRHHVRKKERKKENKKGKTKVHFMTPQMPPE